MQEKHAVVESKPWIYLYLWLIILFCWFPFSIIIAYFIYLPWKIKEKYYIDFFSDILTTAKRKNWYSYKNLYSTDVEDVQINYEEIECIEIKKIWGWATFLAVLWLIFGIPLIVWISKNKEVIIHLRTWENIDIKRLNWNNEFEENLDYKRRNLLVHTNSKGKLIKKNKNFDEKILNELVENDDIQIKKDTQDITNNYDIQHEIKKERNENNNSYFNTCFRKLKKFNFNKRCIIIISFIMIILIILFIKIFSNKNKIELWETELKQTETQKNITCNTVNCIINKWFEFYQKWDYFNAKQSFDNAFLKAGYWDKWTIDSNNIVKIIKAINDIYNKSWFNEISDWSYSGDVSTEVYIDSINYGNYLIDIIKNSDDTELQEKSYNLLFELCDTVIDFDFMSSRRIYFNILDSLNGLIPENYRLKIYEWIILSDINWINNLSTSENDKAQYYSEIETASYYALLLDDNNPRFYYYKWVAEYKQNKTEETIRDLETFLNIQDEYIGSSWSLIQTYLSLWLSYYVQWFKAEQNTISEKAANYFEKAENMFKNLIKVEKNKDNYRYLWAMCIKKVNNLDNYTVNDYETCCNYRKEWMTLWLDTNGILYSKHSTYCAKINRYTFQHVDF